MTVDQNSLPRVPVGVYPTLGEHQLVILWWQAVRRGSGSGWGSSRSGVGRVGDGRLVDWS